MDKMVLTVLQTQSAILQARESFRHFIFWEPDDPLDSIIYRLLATIPCISRFTVVYNFIIENGDIYQPGEKLDNLSLVDLLNLLDARYTSASAHAIASTTEIPPW